MFLSSQTFFSDLIHISTQNVIPNTLEAFQDLLNDVISYGVAHRAGFKRTRIYPKRTIDPDDKLDNIYRFGVATHSGSTAWLFHLKERKN